MHGKMIAFHWLIIKIGPKWLNWNSLSLISYSVPLCIKLRASPVVLSMWTCKNIFHIQVELFTVFCNPTHQTEPGTANRLGTTNSKPPAPISMMGEWETLSSNPIICITLFFLHVHRVGASFTSHVKLSSHTELKPFSCFDLFFIQF
jgi:hypothetical protein